MLKSIKKGKKRMEKISFLIVIFCVFSSVLSAQNKDRILISSMGNDCEYRISRTVRHHLKKDTYQVERNVDDGEQVLNILQGAPLNLWINFSHGDDHRIWGKNRITKMSHYSSGLTMFSNPPGAYPESRSLEDLKAAIENKEIQFAENGLIILHACELNFFVLNGSF